MAIRIIKAAAGLGKTSALIRLLDDTLYGKVEIYVPTHDLAEQVSDSLEAAFQNHVVIKGRSHPYGNGKRMCAKYEEAELLVAKGYPVYPVLCAKRDAHGHTEDCDHYARCPYIAQFEGPERIYVYTHASLPLERGRLEECMPGLAVIDESFFRSCIDIFELPEAELLALVPGSQAHAVSSAMVEILRAGTPLLSELRTRGLQQALELAMEETKPTLPNFSPWWPPTKQMKALKKLAVRPRVRELLETLNDELATPRAESHAFLRNVAGKAIRVHRRLPITRFHAAQGKTDVLILDADADPLILQQWFPGAAFDSIPADRKAHVVQCSSTRCSTTSLVPLRNKEPSSKADAQQRLKDIQGLIERKAEGGRRVLVVGPQAVTGNLPAGIPPLITVPVGSELAHFGAIRGVDRWKNFDVAIIVGRNQPPIDGVEGLARAIWFDDSKPLAFAEDWVIENRGYRVRGGTTGAGIDVNVHPDPRVQAVVEQVRERESTQAIDRLRLIHAPEPKEVIILSSVPLDIDVDELKSWQEIVLGTRLERAWAQLKGVLPLSPAWLAARFPDLWETEAAAEADVRGLAKNREFSNRVSIRNSTVLTVHYRAAGQKRHSVAISALPLAATQIELSRLVGGKPLLVAEVLDGLRGLEGANATGAVTLKQRQASADITPEQ